MTSIADNAVKIQTTSESNPSTPAWFGEVVLISSSLRKHSVLSKISEGVRFARRRFGRYEVIDFLAVLFGYEILGERTLEEFYERLQPFAVPFMALFERDRLPSPPVQRSHAFWQRSPRPLLTPCARSFSMTCSVARTLLTSKREGWWIEQGTPGWSSTLMAHVKPQCQ